MTNNVEAQTEQYVTCTVQAEAVNEGIKLTLVHKDSIHRLDPQGLRSTRVSIVRLADHVTEEKFLDACRKAKADLKAMSKTWAKDDESRKKLRARSEFLLNKLVRQGW